MHSDEPRARIGYRGSAVSRAKNLALKSFVVLGSVLMLASAFVLSVVFLAIGLAVVLGVGGYLWWQTRDLRKQMRARMQEPPQSAGQVIEGEFVSLERTRR
jgi:O-antigen/teichoic acid export membrane protein